MNIILFVLLSCHIYGHKDTKNGQSYGGEKKKIKSIENDTQYISTSKQRQYYYCEFQRWLWDGHRRITWVIK